MRFPHLVWLHISGGIVGIPAGTAAMTFRKGSRRHALAGDVFVIAMLAMSGTGVHGPGGSLRGSEYPTHEFF
jgi:uncharacterized membrane protein